MRKLSDLLVSERVLEKAQVDEALEAQALYGGALDTCLMELGYCDEPTLERIIAATADAPNHVNPRKDLPNGDALSLLSSLDAARWRVIPFRIDARTLDVVCGSPPDLRTLDEVAFKTGLRIRPSLTTELRVAVLLEQHYRIVRTTRFQELMRGTLLVPGASGDDAFRSSADDGVSMPSIAMGDAADFDPPPQPAPTPLDEEDVPVRVPDYKPVDYSPDRFDASLADFEDDRGEPTGVRKVNARLRVSHDRDELPALVFMLLSTQVRRAALFTVARGLCQGWDAWGRDVDPQRLRTMTFPLTHPSIFQEASEGDVFVGRMPFTKVNDEVARRLGEPRMQWVIVTPIKIRDKVVTMLLADCETERALEKAFTSVVDTADKLARTLVRIILEKKKAAL